MGVDKNDAHLTKQLRLFSLALFCFSQFNVYFRFCSRHSRPCCLSVTAVILSIYSCFSLHTTLVRSCFYIDRHTPLDHALLIEVCVIVVHLLNDMTSKEKYRRQKKKKQKREKKKGKIFYGKNESNKG